MKFIKLKAHDRMASYGHTEYNEPDLQMLTSLLARESYDDIDWYLEWACTLNIESNGISGNSIDLDFDGEKIRITYLWDSCSCDDENCEKGGEEEGHEIYRYDITKLNLIDAICQWKAIIGEDPIQRDLEEKSPENIVIMQDKNNKIKIEVIGSQDIRFSRFIKDKNQPWMKLIKSDIFDNYFKVESNNELLYKLGLFLSRYELQKETIDNWVDSNDKDSPMIFIGNLTAVYRTKDMFSIGYNGLELSKDKFIDLGHQWEDLIKNSDLTEVEVQYENNEVNLIPQY